MTCSDRLKAATKSVHTETESVLIKKLKAISSIRDYASILRTFYGFFYPVESAIRNYIDRNILDDIDERRKADTILIDLRTLGYEARIPISSATPTIESPLSAFGTMYVTEGSTLGGPIIAQMLRQNDKLREFGDALNFFDGYKHRTIPMWKKFQSHLNTFEDDQQQLAIAAAASETFSTMKTWLLLSLDAEGVNHPNL